MKRRLLDRYVLAGVKNIGRSLQIHAELVEKTEIRLEINLSREHKILDVAPLGSQHAFEMILALEAVATSSEDTEKKFYSGSVRLKAVFVSETADGLSLEELDKSAHGAARYLYPVARMELFRLFCGARVTDAPIPWDMGIDIAAVEDEGA